MRILFLTHRLPYAPNRGDRIRAHHLLQLLGRAHEVHLVSLIHSDDEQQHLHDLDGVVASVTGARVHRVGNLISAMIALTGQQPLTHVLLHSPEVAPTLERLAVMGPDLVVAYCSGMARYALEPPLDRFPLVFDMVDVDSEKWAALSRTSGLPKRWIYRREATTLRDFERRVVRRALATLVVSERERALLEEIEPGSGAIVVENGVDVAAFASPGPPETEPRVVFCGVFDYGPNEAGAVWMAHEVWPLVKRHCQLAHFSLVGMNPTKAVRALGRDDSILVTGAVSDVREYLWRSAVAVAPVWMSRGVQNKVLEAVAAGLPCVVTPPVFDGLPLTVRPACLVAGDASAFAEAIVSLLRQSPDARRELARRADLSRLPWQTQLFPVLGIVAAGARRED